MSRARVRVGALLAVIGGVWIGQGTGLIPGSIMTSDVRWAIAGAVLLVVAVALIWSARRADRP